MKHPHLLPSLAMLSIDAKRDLEVGGGHDAEGGHKEKRGRKTEGGNTGEDNAQLLKENVAGGVDGLSKEEGPRAPTASLDLQVRVGLEIETCYRGPEKLMLKSSVREGDQLGMFRATYDSSIVCGNGDFRQGVEFIVDDDVKVTMSAKDTTFFDPLHSESPLALMIDDIDTRLFPFIKECAKIVNCTDSSCITSTCGTHVHMSCSSFTLDDNPFLFAILQQKWIDEWQPYFCKRHGTRTGWESDRFCNELGEVLGAGDVEAYRNVALNLNPTLDGEPTWQGKRIEIRLQDDANTTRQACLLMQAHVGETTLTSELVKVADTILSDLCGCKWRPAKDDEIFPVQLQGTETPGTQYLRVYPLNRDLERKAIFRAIRRIAIESGSNLDPLYEEAYLDEGFGLEATLQFERPLRTRTYHVEFRGMGDFVEKFKNADGGLEKQKLWLYLSDLYKFFTAALSSDPVKYNFEEFQQVDFCEMGLRESSLIEKVIRNNKTMKRLNLMGNYFSDESVKRMARIAADRADGFELILETYYNDLELEEELELLECFESPGNSQRC